MMSNDKIQVGTMSEEEYKSYIEKFHDRAYTEQELAEEYNIWSNAYGGVLCSKKGSEDLVLFNKISCPVSDAIFFIKIGGY